MTRHRVVITGIGLTSPIGETLDAASSALREGRHGIQKQPSWATVTGLEARLGAPVSAFDPGAHPRKKVRAMGRVGLLALHAAERCLADARLDLASLTQGRVGVAFGSTHGSSEAMEVFTRELFSTYALTGLQGTAYLKFMSHTCAANLAQYYGIRGRVVPTSAACVSGSLAIGVGYELVRAGTQDAMLCGGAEELHFVHAAVFDMLYAASRRYNDRPDESPRPFDAARDGLVVGEGAGALLLERYEHALARGVTPYAELIGYGSNSDGTHVTAPSAEGMAAAMRLALADADLAPTDVGYVNAHATATDVGDIAEARATREVFGDGGVPLSSTKGHTGHTLGACGALEAAFCVAVMRDGFLPATRNLTRVGDGCEGLDHVMGAARDVSATVTMSNNFAFGGLNTSLIFRRMG